MFHAKLKAYTIHELTTCQLIGVLFWMPELQWANEKENWTQNNNNDTKVKTLETETKCMAKS